MRPNLFRKPISDYKKGQHQTRVLEHAFNEALRQATFAVINGKASREYDNGK